MTLYSCDKQNILTDEEKAFVDEVKNTSSQYYRSLLTDDEEILLYDEILSAVILHDKEYTIRHFDSVTAGPRFCSILSGCFSLIP